MLRFLHITVGLRFNKKMTTFTQCLKPLTGLASWEAKDDKFDYHQEIARSAFADMLHDHERNEKYYIALKRAIDKKHQAGEKANVLDIGTGTGILAMMAAKCGADTITACEAFTPMAECALKIIKENGYADKIKVIRKRSTLLTVGIDGDLLEKANILVTEVFDTELIGEGALPTFRSAHKNVLTSDCIVVPDSGTIWVQVVESPYVSGWNKPRPIKDADNKNILIDVPERVKLCSGSSSLHDLQLSQLPYDSFTPLLPPQPIFKFDWSGKQKLVYYDKSAVSVPALKSGTAHALFLWWELDMDGEGKVLLSCAPVWEHPDAKKLIKQGKQVSELKQSIPWRDHWMQAIYYFPHDVRITAGSNINLIGYHDEYSFWFQLSYTDLDQIEDIPRPTCSCYLHIACSRTRIGQLNDEERNRKYLRVLEKAIKPGDVCLCLSDVSLLGLAAAKLGAKKIYIPQLNFLSTRTIESFAKANNLLDNIEIVEDLSLLPAEKGIDIIIGEPFFIGSIVPWENLRFWYIGLKYSSKVRRIPAAATIKAVAVEFKDLHKIRAPLGICEGFDLSTFDKLVQVAMGKTDASVEAQPLWEYPCRALSSPFELKSFDLSSDSLIKKRVKFTGTIPFLKSGSCNGVAMWVDWHLDSDTIISTGPKKEIEPGFEISWDPFTRQGVHLFKNASDVTNENSLEWEFHYQPQDGDMDFDFKIL